MEVTAEISRHLDRVGGKDYAIKCVVERSQGLAQICHSSILTMTEKVFTHDDYVKEREHLSKCEQANYDSYEKTILTLSGAFLAFSVSFLGLVMKTTAPPAAPVVLTSPAILICSWVSFALSIVIMLLCFLINALAFRKEVATIEDAVDDVHALNTKNIWTAIGYTLYILSGLSFCLGLALLLIFCGRNVQLF